MGFPLKSLEYFLPRCSCVLGESVGRCPRGAGIVGAGDPECRHWGFPTSRGTFKRVYRGLTGVWGLRFMGTC